MQVWPALAAVMLVIGVQSPRPGRSCKAAAVLVPSPAPPPVMNTVSPNSAWQWPDSPVGKSGPRLHWPAW